VAGWIALIHPDDRAMMEAYLNQHVIGEGKLIDKYFRIIRQSDQAERWVHGYGKLALDKQGLPLTMYGTIQDVTERKQIEEQVRQLAFYDPLTGLPNRRLLDDRMTQAMAASKRSGLHCALMFLDLDNFKSLNDAYGHEVGDLLLIEVAKRLTACVREVDTVARFGGDEFVVILGELEENHAASTEQARLIAEKIQTSLALPYLLNVPHCDDPADHLLQYHCSASIGVMVCDKHELSMSDAMKRADAAMYRAKDAGRNAIRFFEITKM
jgi:diguanylate cyclase (GGDEF)-like protein